MQFTTSIDNKFCLNNNLDIKQGYLLSWMISSVHWAETLIEGSDIYYWLSRTKAVEEIPLLTKKIDTMYRHYKFLADNDFIMLKKVGERDYVAFTSKTKGWNVYKRTSEHSEENPRQLGQTSENSSEENPTDKYKNKISIVNDKNNSLYDKNENISQQEPISSKEEKEKEKKEKEIPYRKFVHLSITHAEVEKIQLMGYSIDQIDSILDQVENSKKNVNYKSLFLTAKNWLRNEPKLGQQKQSELELTENNPYARHNFYNHSR